MSSPDSDYAKRDLGRHSAVAFQAFELAAWNRSAALLKEADSVYLRGEMTPDKAHSFLVSMLEARRLHEQLKAQVSDGVKAARRIDKEIDQVAEKTQKQERAKAHGLNRFTRSRVAG